MFLSPLLPVCPRFPLGLVLAAPAHIPVPRLLGAPTGASAAEPRSVGWRPNPRPRPPVPRKGVALVTLQDPETWLNFHAQTSLSGKPAGTFGRLARGCKKGVSTCQSRGGGAV